MTLTDRSFRPCETLIKPLDLPITELPDKARSDWYGISPKRFAMKTFSYVLNLVSLLAIVSALNGLSVIWTLAYIVGGVVASIAASFVE